MLNYLCQNGIFQIRIYIVFSTLLAQKENFDEAQLLMAYREFVESRLPFLNNESDYKTLIRELNLTYIEFEALKIV